MIHENIELTGSFNVNGTLVIPTHAATTSALSATGSIYNDSTDNVVKIYTGTEWIVVGDQTSTPSATIEYLVVAGGGGGAGFGGGGGAGGLLSSSLSSIESGSSIAVTIGAGGAGGDGNFVEGLAGSDSSVASSTGTSFTTVTATGGGFGAGNGNAGDGGSGGGAELDDGTNPFSGGTGTAGQGNDGGDGNVTGNGGGGGGGAGAVGSDAPTNHNGANGGDGKSSSITGVSTTYAGGGGGGFDGLVGGTTGGSGGSGGGGAGGQNGTAGTANTGGGGGGAGRLSEGGATAGNGGSGVAIFAYDSGSFNCAGGIVGDAGNGRKYNQFNSSGTFKVASTTDFSIVTDNLTLNLDAGNNDSRGTSTWTDLSGNAGTDFTVNNATLSNNFYYSFNGSSTWASSDSSLTHTSTNNLSIEFWIKSTSTSQADYANILDFNHSTAVAGSTGTGWVIQQLASNQNYFYFAYHDGSTYQETSSVNMLTLSVNTWTHYVLTKNSTTIQAYINGSAGNSYTASNANVANPTQKLRIASYLTGPNTRNFIGEIAQVRLYGDALSATEVLQNYNATKTNFI